MANKGLLDFFKVELNTEEVASNAIGGVAGLTAGYVTEVVIDSLLPELSGVKLVAAQCGKWVIAGAVTAVTGDVVADEVKAYIALQKETRRLTEKILLGEGDDEDYDIF